MVCLHGVCADGFAGGGPDTIAERVLAAELRWMQSIGPIVPLEEALRERSQKPRFALVFDDATVSVATLAAPLLGAATVPWSVAVPTALVGSGRSLWIRDFEWILRHSNRSALSIAWEDGSPPEWVRTHGHSNAGVERFHRVHFSRATSHSGEIVTQAVRQLAPDDPARQVPGDIRIGDEAHLKDCVEHGATLVSHGAHHLPLPHLSSDEVVAEWREGRDWLVARFPNATVADTLVAPYGRVASHAVPALREAGCRFVVAGVNGIAGVTVDPYRIPRIPGASETVAGFAARVARNAPTAIPVG